MVPLDPSCPTFLCQHHQVLCDFVFLFEFLLNGCTIAINVTVERDDFAIQVYDNDEQLSLIFLPTGEDLLMFLLSLRRELVDSKYYK